MISVSLFSLVQNIFPMLLKQEAHFFFSFFIFLCTLLTPPLLQFITEMPPSFSRSPFPPPPSPPCLYLPAAVLVCLRPANPYALFFMKDCGHWTLQPRSLHTNTHTSMYKYMYFYINVCVCLFEDTHRGYINIWKSKPLFLFYDDNNGNTSTEPDWWL